MSIGLLLLIILGLGLAGWLVGRQRAVASVAGDIRKLHSLPGYYGHTVFLMTTVPAFLLMIAWTLVQPVVIETRIADLIAPADIPEGSSRGLVMADVRRIAGGLDAVVARGEGDAALAAMAVEGADIRAQLAEAGVAVGAEVKPSVLAAALEYRSLSASALTLLAVAALILSLAGLGWSISRIQGEYRARNATESFVMWLLIGCSLIAVLTTVGIISSLVFETAHFFRLYPASDFFFSTTWNPQFRGGSSLGIWPLIWGTR